MELHIYIYSFYYFDGSCGPTGSYFMVRVRCVFWSNAEKGQVLKMLKKCRNLLSRTADFAYSDLLVGLSKSGFGWIQNCSNDAVSVS